MAVSRDYESFLYNQLTYHGIFTFKRMFGGLGIYQGGTFFAVVDNDQIFFRVTESEIPQFEAFGMGPFAPIPGKPPMRSYFQLPEEILNDQSELGKWVKQAIAAAIAAKVKSVRKTRRTKTLAGSKSAAKRAR